MCDNTQAEVLKDLGIYAITATVTLNAGVFGIVLANVKELQDKNQIDLKYIKRAFWSFWLGLIFSAIAVLITYCVTLWMPLGFYLGHTMHTILMVFPTLFSFLCFIYGAFILIDKFKISH